MDMMSYLMGRNSGGAKKGVKIEVVTELPETGEANVIYLVPKETEDENNVFDEYIWINDEWELIGTTDIDLSNYYTKSEIDGKFPPIYVLNTTDDLSDGDKSFGNNEKNQFSTIITDAYAKGFKGIVVLLISTTSGRTYVFYSSNQITNRSFPELVTDYSQSNRGIQMQKVYIRRLYTVGSWNNDVFTCSSLDCSSVRANLLTSDNVTAYNVSNDYTPAHKKYVDDNKGQTIQYETMPTASADYLGKIVQYTGTTDSNYTNGYFYVCISETENDVTTYSWSNIEVQNMPDLSEYLNNSEVIAYELGGINLTLNVNGAISLTNVSARNAVVSAINKHIDKEPFMMCFIDSNKNMAIMFIQRIKKQYGSNVNFYPTFLYLGANGGSVWFGTNRLIMSFDKTTGLVNSATISDSTYGTTEIIKANRVLTKTNTDTYTPTADYHPATKKYVDDSIAAAITTTLGGSY